MVYGIVQGGDTGSWLRGDVLGPMFGGLAVLGVFAWYESRISHPSLDVRLFADRRLSASVGAIALLFFGMGGVYFFTTFYLQNVRGYSALDAGLLTMPFAAGQLLLAPRSAGLVQRYGAKAVGATGMLVMAVALAGYALLGTTHADLGAGRAVRHPGRRRRRRHAVGHLRGDGRAAAGAGRRGLRADQHLPPDRGGARRGRARLDPGPGLPQPAAAQPVGACRRRRAARPASRSPPPRRSRSTSARRAASLLAPADAAFTDAMHVTTLVAALIALAGALVVLRWMPGLRARRERAGGGRRAGAEHGEMAVQRAGVEG